MDPKRTGSSQPSSFHFSKDSTSNRLSNRLDPSIQEEPALPNLHDEQRRWILKLTGSLQKWREKILSPQLDLVKMIMTWIKVFLNCKILHLFEIFLFVLVLWIHLFSFPCFKFSIFLLYFGFSNNKISVMLSFF